MSFALLTQARQLLHAGIDHGSEEEEAAHDETTATTDAATANVGDGRSYTWLKWVSVAVLFVEGMVGVLLPVLLKLTVRPGWLLSVVNCFAGGVFFSFGEWQLCRHVAVLSTSDTYMTQSHVVVSDSAF